MKVLFIWDQIGEGEDGQPELYEATGDAAVLAAKCNGQYINSVDTADDAAVFELQGRFFYDDEGEKRPPSPDFVKIEANSGARGPYDQIIIAGFLP